MEKTAGGSYSMWNFLEGIGKFVGDQQKKPHSLGVPFFGLFWSWYWPWECSHFYGFTPAMTFKFPKISKTNPETSVEYLQRHFFNHPAFCSRS